MQNTASSLQDNFRKSIMRFIRKVTLKLRTICSHLVLTKSDASIVLQYYLAFQFCFDKLHFANNNSIVMKVISQAHYFDGKFLK